MVFDRITKEVNVNVLSIINKSGIDGYVICLLSIISWAIIFKKLWMLRISKLIPKKDVNLTVDFLSDGNVGDVVELCKKRKTFLSSVILNALKSMGELRRSNFLSSFEAAAKREFGQLENGMTALATIAAVSPLLGLLGTVLGMVKIFGVLGSFGMGTPQQLAGGIAEALLTTVEGLITAIPAVIMYNIFQKKLDRIAVELENIGILMANNFKGLK